MPQISNNITSFTDHAAASIDPWCITTGLGDNEDMINLDTDLLGFTEWHRYCCKQKVVSNSKIRLA